MIIYMQGDELTSVIFHNAFFHGKMVQLQIMSYLL